MFPLFKIITGHTNHCHTTQSSTTPSGNNARKFSAEVSDVNVAAKAQGPQVADLDNCSH